LYLKPSQPSGSLLVSEDEDKDTDEDEDGSESESEFETAVGCSDTSQKTSRSAVSIMAPACSFMLQLFAASTLDPVSLESASFTVFEAAAAKEDPPVVRLGAKESL
jgi:hypothetical protein